MLKIKTVTLLHKSQQKWDNPEAVKKLVTAGTNTKLMNNADQSLHALMMNFSGGAPSTSSAAAGAA